MAETNTTTGLRQLLDRRNAAMKRLAASNKALGQMESAERKAADEASREFREADGAIVEILNRLEMPVRVGPVELHLTSDRRSFAEVDPATCRPVHILRSGTFSESLLYRYPTAKG